MSGRKLAKIALISAVFGLAGCTTVKLPDINLLRMTGLFDNKDKIDGYPRVSDAPDLPTGTRTNADWDTEAKAIIKKRDVFNDLDGNGVAISDAEFQRDVEALKAKVRAYKADDPPYPQTHECPAVKGMLAAHGQLCEPCPSRFHFPSKLWSYFDLSQMPFLPSNNVG